MKINSISLSASKLRMLRLNDQNEELTSAVGSGFFWTAENKLYIITTWHNVTGLNADTTLMMGKFIPNALEFSLFRHVNDKQFGIAFPTIALYDEMGPIWLEHPEGPGVDCVAIPLPIDPSDKALISSSLNTLKWEEQLEPAIGMECFIIGYPKGLVGPALSPIWKRGSIATAPLLDLEDKPLILVDTATRAGMSGSPVIYRHHGVYSPDGDLAKAMLGTLQNTLGIYSGRLGEDELGVQLGRVWKMSVVTEILAHAKRGIDPNMVTLKHESSAE